MDWRAAARSDVGNVRERNEDSYLIDEEHGLFVVADGMGGRIGGDVASQILVETLEAEGASLERAARKGDVAGDTDHRQRMLKLLTSSLLEANREIYNTGQGQMGTTAEVLLMTPTAALLAHVGDSRTYVIRDGIARRLTTDHNYAERPEGPPSSVVAESSENETDYSNVLTRSIGGAPHVRVDTVYVELRPGDRFLLATDGLSDHVDDSRLQQLAEVDDPEAFARDLVRGVRTSGGLDDTTALAVDVFAPEDEPGFYEPSTVETTRKVELLRELDLFQEFDDRTILRLLRHIYTVGFDEGEHLIEQGAEGRSMFILVEGTAEVRREGETLQEIGPGNHVGEMALIDDSPRSADVVATEQCKALAISPGDFHEMVSSNPRVGNRILSNMLEHCVARLRRTTEVLLIDDEQ